MGLAPYGDPDVYRDRLRQLVRTEDLFELNLELLHAPHEGCGHDVGGRLADDRADLLEATRGAARPRSHSRAANLRSTTKTSPQRYRPSSRRCTCTSSARHTSAPYDGSVSRGGVALNAVANGRIRLETPFEGVYIQPAAGDSGIAVGAAYYV